nr:Huntingtin-interacting protein K [Tanacetum cinerariifolium]
MLSVAVTGRLTVALAVGLPRSDLENGGDTLLVEGGVPKRRLVFGKHPKLDERPTGQTLRVGVLEIKMEGGEENVEIENLKDLQQQSKALDKHTDHHDDNHHPLDSTRV